MTMWRRFRAFSLFKQIILTVLFFHMLMLAFLLVDHNWVNRDRPTKKIAVRTFISKPISIQPIKSQTGDKKSSPPQKLPPPNKPKPVKSQSGSKEEPKRENVKKREAAVMEKKKAHSAEQAVLLQEIAESLEVLSAVPESRSVSRKLILPSSIPKRIEIDEEIAVNPSYGEALGFYLQQTLDLPEYGEVKAKLTIDSNGTLLSIEILETRSKKNSEFLKKRLPDLTFPCFNDFGIFETVHNFTITFTNVETP